MPNIISRVYPGLQPLPTTFKPWVLRLVHGCLPFLLRFRLRPWLPTGIHRIDATHPDILVNLFKQFQSGEIRFMVAFRHVEVDDPLCGLYLFSRILPKTAQRMGVSLKQPLHTYFLYDRGMPLWGGKMLGWMLSRIGGISLHRGRHPDWHALKLARRLMVEGELPMAVAPEGATNGHSNHLASLEPGVAQLGVWCAEDLERQGKDQAVWIVPVGLRYTYPNPNWDKLDRLMLELEMTAGLATYAEPRPAGMRREEWYKNRLVRLSTSVLESMEDFYKRFYHCKLDVQIVKPTKSDKKRSPDLATVLRSLEQDEEKSQSFDDRLQILLDAVLKVAESYFGVSSRGTLADRCRRIEEASWTYIYRPDVTDRAELSPMQQGLGDWVAAEASLRSLHMRLVESFVSVHENYVTQHPSFERLAETSLLLFDVMARIRGDRYPRRPRLGNRHAHFTVCEPISVQSFLPQYRASRQGAKEAIAQLTEELQTALQSTLP